MAAPRSKTRSILASIFQVSTRYHSHKKSKVVKLTAEKSRRVVTRAEQRDMLYSTTHSSSFSVMQDRPIGNHTVVCFKICQEGRFIFKGKWGVWITMPSYRSSLWGRWGVGNLVFNKSNHMEGMGSRSPKELGGVLDFEHSSEQKLVCWLLLYCYSGKGPSFVL